MFALEMALFAGNPSSPTPVQPELQQTAPLHSQPKAPGQSLVDSLSLPSRVVPNPALDPALPASKPADDSPAIVAKEEVLIQPEANEDSQAEEVNRVNEGIAVAGFDMGNKESIDKGDKPQLEERNARKGNLEEQNGQVKDDTALSEPMEAGVQDKISANLSASGEENSARQTTLASQTPATGHSALTAALQQLVTSTSAAKSAEKQPETKP